VFGVVLGAMAVRGVQLRPSLAARDVTVLTVLLDLGSASSRRRSLVPIRARSWPPTGERLEAVGSRPSLRSHPWPLLAILLVCGAWTIHFLHQRTSTRRRPLHRLRQHLGDWAAHLSFTGSFAYATTFRRVPDRSRSTGSVTRSWSTSSRRTSSLLACR